MINEAYWYTRVAAYYEYNFPLKYKGFMYSGKPESKAGLKKVG